MLPSKAMGTAAITAFEQSAEVNIKAYILGRMICTDGVRGVCNFQGSPTPMTLRQMLDGCSIFRNKGITLSA